MCCTRLAEKTGRKKSPKIAIWPLSHNLSGYIFATEARIDNRKNLLSSNMSSTCLHNMVNFDPLAAEICLPVWGTPANFDGFRVLAALLHGCQIVNVSQTLRHWTEGATYVRQGDHHVGHWPTFLVFVLFWLSRFYIHLFLFRSTDLMHDILIAFWLFAVYWNVTEL